jgi:hypothetical protein
MYGTSIHQISSPGKLQEHQGRMTASSRMPYYPPFLSWQLSHGLFQMLRHSNNGFQDITYAEPTEVLQVQYNGAGSSPVPS